MGLALVYSRVQQVIDSNIGGGVGGWLFEKLATVQEIHPMGPDDMIRASGIGFLCPRLETLCAKHGIIRTRTIGPDLQWKFDVGTLTHHLYRDWYLGPHGMYLGRWKCLRCGWDTDKSMNNETRSFKPNGSLPGEGVFNLVKMPIVCEKCGHGREDGEGSKTIVFSEWDLQNDEYGITGHTDGWRFCPESNEVILQEIKSADPSSFAYTTINGPHPYTLKQIQVYMWMTGIKRGEVIYINKAGKDPKGKHGMSIHHGFFVPHIIDYDEDWLRYNVLNNVKYLRDCLRKGNVAERQCSNINSQFAKMCNYKELCFKENE